jgi:hypothetical protein
MILFLLKKAKDIRDLRNWASKVDASCSACPLDEQLRTVQASAQ